MDRLRPVARFGRTVLALSLLCLVPAVVLAAAPPPGNGPWVVKASFQERGQVDRFAADYEPWDVRHDQGYILVDVDRAGWQRLLDLGFVVEIDAARTAELVKPRVALPGQGGESIPGYPCYRTVEETFTSAQDIVTAYPNLASWIDIGDSWDKQSPNPAAGYDMMVLRLTNAATTGPKPKLISTSAIHAREYTTAELMTRFAEYLVTQYGTNPDVTWFLDHQEVHLILQANPDGRKKAEQGASWRKNTDTLWCGTPSLQGIDLNRNYPFLWGCCGGSSGSGCSETYRGPSAGSESETWAVRDYLRANFPDYGDPWGGTPPPVDAAGIFLDIHSYGMRVMWPWGHTTQVAPNGIALQTLGRKYAYFNNHNPHQAIYLYTTDGTTRDFGYGDLGVATFTFELGTSFFQDCPTFENVILPTNLQSLLYAVRVVRAPYLLPAGPDALSVATIPSGNVNTGQPLVVNATINDTRYSNSNGTEPVQNIAAAEVYVDTPPWSPGAAPVAMVPSDGTFNATIEPVTTTLSTAGWSLGRHTLFVRWGPVSAVFVDVVVPVELQGFVVE
jgi:carboxypeptidase T